MKNITSDFIKKQIICAGKSFGTYELAYLALTSKIERPFVDRLAYCAFKSLRRDDLDIGIAREWGVSGKGRADLAILHRDEPEKPMCIVEVKAMASFDCVRPMLNQQREYPERLQKDLDRYSKIKLPSTEIYSLLLATHPLNKVPDRKEVIKYIDGFNKAFDVHTCADTIRHLAEKNLFRDIRRAELCESGVLHGGTAYGVRVELLWWLFGPFAAGRKIKLLK